MFQGLNLLLMSANYQSRVQYPKLNFASGSCKKVAWADRENILERTGYHTTKGGLYDP